MVNLRRDKKPWASSNQIIHYEEKIVEYKVLPSLGPSILSWTTCLEPSSFSFRLSSFGKYLESTLGLELDLFLNPHKKKLVFYPNMLNIRAIWEMMKSIVNQPIWNKNFSLKNDFQLKLNWFSHKANTRKKNLKLKIGFFTLTSILYTSRKRVWVLGFWNPSNDWDLFGKSWQFIVVIDV